jgi:hypothetical protein
MQKPDPHLIREAFNKAQQAFHDENEKSGLGPALESISGMVKDLKDAGLDVSLEIAAGASEMAFGLFESNGMTVPVSGILRMGNIHRLVAIATSLGNTPALMLSMSAFDIRFEGNKALTLEKSTKNNIRTKTYDLLKDPAALAKLQNEIIRYCARSAEIAARDVRDALDTGSKDTLKKFPLKKSLQKTP